MTSTGRLGDLVSFLSGCPFKSALFNTDGVGLPLARIRDVVPGRSGTYYSGEFEKTYVLADGDYLIGMDGEFNLARWRGGPALLNQRVCKVDQVSDELDLGYLARFLPSALKAIEAVTPFATVKHLSVKSLREIEIPLPPVEEQRRIAAILDQADALRTKRREALAHLEDLTQSIFFDMFGDPTSNPMHWPLRSLGELSSIAGEYGAGVASVDFDPELPRYVRITDVTESGELKSEVKAPGGTARDWSRYMLDEGDLLFARSGATVGKTYLHRAKNGPCVFAGYMIRFRPNPASLSPVFAFHFTKTQSYAIWVTARQRVVAQPNINAQQYGQDLLLPVPPLERQHEFASRVAALDHVRDQGRGQLSRLDSLFASLQSRAFAGEL